MHKIKLSEVSVSEKQLTQAVLQITQMLGIYNAELARILCCKCADIGNLSNLKATINKGSKAWYQAEKLIQMYEALYLRFNGDEVLINNWLRKKNTILRAVPLYEIIDKLSFNEVLKVINIETLPDKKKT